MIYIIKDKEVDLCKIGYSCNPIDRIRSFGIGRDNLETILIMPGDRAKEKMLHDCFSHRRVKHPNPKSFIGNGWTEWFRLRPNEISKIKNSYIKRLDAMEERLGELETKEKSNKISIENLYSIIQSKEDMIEEIAQLYMGKFWEEKRRGIGRDLDKDEIAKKLIFYQRYSKLRRE